VKYAKIGSLLKREKRIILYDAPGGDQWIGDGCAVYPLFGLPELDEESTCTIFDVSAKQLEKIYFLRTKMPEGISLEDTHPAENMLEKGDLIINTGGYSLVPLETQNGMTCIDAKYLAPFSDVLDVVELYERPANGTIHIAVKAGLMLAGIILPTTHAVKKEFVEQVERLARHFRVAYEVKQEQDAARVDGQTALDEKREELG
jgi:hypothetical protein